ncbi:FMN-binding protein [Desulfobulbus elongatus]|uniref:FMN-binding protein n=1 Tax=Desulfobulbus elongatus TaxID=53332 RepID=UPI00048904E7|nr:FMN-binding protein [Desulfobulbus elongatus]
MKDILTIVFRLTVSCLMAAAVMGAAFIVTDKAKKHNEHVREEKTMYGLLGYGARKPVPPTLALHQIYRYVITDQGRQHIGYLLPTGREGKTEYTLVLLDLDGKMVSQQPTRLDGDQSREKETRDRAVMEAIGPGKGLRFADHTIVVTDSGKRVAYLLGGKFPGFKTFINVMLALDPQYAMLGLEVLEHEEDPGLGAEIEKNYFKNQFKGRSFDVLKGLQVVKEPLPEQYRQALEAQVTEEDAARIMGQYRAKNIYALTGATISSRMLTDGVKGLVTKCAYRLDVLDRVLEEQKIAVSF